MRGRHKSKLTANFLVNFDALSRGESWNCPLQVSFHSTRSKCSVNQMQVIKGIVCHLGRVTLYVALIMDCQRKTLKKAFQCNFRGLYEMPTFSESVGESISFTNQKLQRR